MIMLIDTSIIPSIIPTIITNPKSI